MDPQLPKAASGVVTKPPSKPVRPANWQPPKPAVFNKPNLPQHPVGGHPEMERGSAPPVLQAKNEFTKQIEQIQAKPQTLESTAQLELTKEVLPGVKELKEVHHPEEPITLPSQIIAAGVSSVPLPAGAATFKADNLVLPLNSGQIKQGLHANITKSIRWLAEWCLKQLKDAHLAQYRKAKGIKVED